MSWVDDCKDKSPWACGKQPTKLGYMNNPYWTKVPTSKHYPCGYWQENDTLYTTVASQGTGWVKVADPVTPVDGTVNPDGLSLITYNDGVYGVCEGGLYKWDGVSAWNEIIPQQPINQYVSTMVLNNKLYFSAMEAFDTSRVFYWDGTGATWTEIIRGTYNDSYHWLTPVGSGFYMPGGWAWGHHRVYRSDETMLVQIDDETGEDRDAPLFYLPSTERLYLFVYGRWASNIIYRINPSSGAYRGYSYPDPVGKNDAYTYGNSDIVALNNKIYTNFAFEHESTGGSGYEYIGIYQLDEPTGWTPYCINFDLVGSPLHASGSLVTFNNDLYFLGAEGTLYLVGEGTLTKVASTLDLGCIDHATTFCTYDNSLFILTNQGYLLRYGLTYTNDEAIGFTSPSNVIWPFKSTANKVSYNEGDHIATAANPVWKLPTQGSAPITSTHIPCGYWNKK